MSQHPNAKLTPRGRRLLVDRVRRQGLAVVRAARDMGVSRQTAYKWLIRFEKAGSEGFLDRASRPRRMALRTPQRFEHGASGDLLHVDAKKLARIEAVGHRIDGDRSRKLRGVRYEVVLVCVDDHTRLAYAEVFPSESGGHAATFTRHALAWFESLGIRCRRVLTDSAKCYADSKVFQAFCRERGISQRFTRPYTPRTDGKAERFIETLNRRWAYRYVLKTSALRTASLRPWLTHYNHCRPHRALGKKAPMAPLREARQQAA